MADNLLVCGSSEWIGMPTITSIVVVQASHALCRRRRCQIVFSVVVSWPALAAVLCRVQHYLVEIDDRSCGLLGIANEML
jgi:hypothetical protein